MAFGVEVAASRTPLWTETAPGEQALQLGKVHNLRCAARLLDGTIIPAGAIFSFWRQLGRATRARGFVDGRMLREGCLIPAVGGGLCQLSNALYEVALTAGCEIVERHAHSRIVPGSAAAGGRDATVAWNYVDLRFRSDRDLRLAVALGADELIVALDAREAASDAVRATGPGGVERRLLARSCAVCGETACALHERQDRSQQDTLARRAFLVDEDWPEFRAYITSEARAGDAIGLPLDGARWGLRRYRWDTRAFASVMQAPLAALDRSWAWRRTPAEGPARRAAETRTSAAIADALARQLGPEAVELVVAQSLLPSLWRSGWLGGRRFSVLMTRLPITALQARLDEAFAEHPDRTSLADYRAPADIATAEAQALAAAERIVTPHAEIAALFFDRCVKLDWARPSVPAKPGRGIVAFPGPTLARKGAFELRQAAREAGFAVRPLGASLEGAAFWEGVRLEPTPDGGHWLDGVSLVAQPALVENAPRRLLEALAANVPVVATPACGLSPQEGLVLAPPGDPAALAAAIAGTLGRQRRNRSDRAPGT
ncbi:MAG TPA: VanW family protein [Caulobacteraceae bacterium]|nr:VanW family protein [Caulobacteraceae bacterium]